MSLQIWLPLNGDFHNQGIAGDLNFSFTGTITDNANGKIGKSKNFSSAMAKAPFSFTLEDELSFSCWIYYNSFRSDNEWIIELGKTSSGYANAVFGVASTKNNLIFCIGGTSNSATPHGFSVNTWYHLGFTWKDSIAKVYINGSLVREFTLNKGSLISSTNLTLGCNVANSNTKMNGQLNDIRIYDNCLSEKQIKQISKGLILHYPLNRSNWGQDNLILNASTLSVNKLNNALNSRTEYWAANVGQSYINFEGGEKVVLSFDLEMIIRTLPVYFMVYNSNNKGPIQFPTIRVDSQINSLNPEIEQIIKTRIIIPATLTKRENATQTKNFIEFYSNYGSNNFYKISNIKMQMGEKSTAWCPNETEALYNTLGLNNDIQYDVSGYQNNGIKHNITYDSDTPKYEVSSVFTSANTSYVKVSENNWIPQYQQAMTINLWVYSANWASTTKLFSCTESGGWNTESGSSGYIRFPVYVATNSERTSHGYRYSSKELKISDMTAGWHMLTFIYDSTGNKVYVDGQLHSNYAYTSYGIKYNTKALLFLGCEASTASPASPYFNGKMSDFRIYATALSAEDILSLYNNEAEIDQSGIIHGQIR